MCSLRNGCSAAVLLGRNQLKLKFSFSLQHKKKHFFFISFNWFVSLFVLFFPSSNFNVDTYENVWSRCRSINDWQLYIKTKKTKEERKKGTLNIFFLKMKNKYVQLQSWNLLAGFMGLPGGHWNTWAKVGSFWRTPMALYFPGLCASFVYFS